MMKSTTINKLNNLVNLLVANAKYCKDSEVRDSKKSTLFEVLKYAIRKEARRMDFEWGVKATSIAKTPRQLNYVASETEYKLRKLFRQNEALKLAWLPQK